MTVPLTIWSTRNSIASTACKPAIKAPLRIATPTPNQRLWVASAAT